MRFLVSTYISLFLGFYSVTSLAENNSLGLVRIKSTLPSHYNSVTGIKILDSDNTILRIKKVALDSQSGKVNLYVLNNDQYDVIQIFFPFDKNQYFAKKFVTYLANTPNFQINVEPEDLILDTQSFTSVLRISGKSLSMYSKHHKKFIPLSNTNCCANTNCCTKMWMGMKRLLHCVNEFPIDNFLAYRFY